MELLNHISVLQNPLVGAVFTVAGSRINVSGNRYARTLLGIENSQASRDGLDLTKAWALLEEALGLAAFLMVGLFCCAHASCETLSPLPSAR